jgi:hypothetical protein
MALFTTSKPKITVKSLARFPVRVAATDGVQVDKANGVYTFALDLPSLPTNTAVVDATEWTTLVYNTSTQDYETLRLDAIIPDAPEVGSSVDTADTVADFEAYTFNNDVQSVTIHGYTTIGVGGLKVRRVTSEPSHPWKFRSTDRYLPDGSISSVNGGWWEGYAPDGWVNPMQFGALAVGNSGNDDFPAISDMLEYCTYTAVAQGGFSGSAVSIYWPAGLYYSSATIEPTCGVRIRGAINHAVSNEFETKINFPLNTPGMILDYPCDIDGISLVSPDPGAPDNTIHGIEIRKPCRIANVTVARFAGNGFYVNGNSPNVADFVRFDRCYASLCYQSGFYFDGTNSQVCLIENCSAYGCDGFGFRDDSLLANYFVSCHASGCGKGPTSGWVTQGGKTYQAVPVDQNSGVIADTATTTPGTDPAVWYLTSNSALAGVPAYVPGTEYQAGGPYCAMIQWTQFSNCYTEDGQGSSYIAGQLYGGIAGFKKIAYGVGTPFESLTGFKSTREEIPGDAANEDISIQIGGTSNHNPLFVWSVTGADTGLFYAYLEQGDALRVRTTDNQGYFVTCPGSSWQFGSGVSVGSQFGVDYGIALKDYILQFGTTANADYASAGKGWFTFNSNPSSSASPFGWNFTAAGTPGTSQALYAAPYPNLGVTTYGGLPAANSVPAGTTAIITDCNSATLGATAAGGGANRVRVNSDTTNWIIG